MTHYRDQLAGFIAALLPDDMVVLWDNITPASIDADKGFVRVRITESREQNPLQHYLTGIVHFDIATPLGTGTDFLDQVVRLIRQKICFKTAGYLSFQGRQLGGTTIVGGYQMVSVMVGFMHYDAQTYG